MIMQRAFVKKSYYSAAVLNPGSVDFADVKTEAVRKSLHFLIALSPALTTLNFSFAVFILSFGVLGYIIMELLRHSGVKVPLVSTLTRMASRTRERDGFVLGPVTLGLGALFALIFFPFPVASIAIYALAFGDGFASLTGKLYGRLRPAFLSGKSIEGSTACFAATFISAYLVSHSIVISLAAAFAATAIEALPLEDYDNIALPLAVGFVVQIFYK